MPQPCGDQRDGHVLEVNEGAAGVAGVMGPDMPDASGFQSSGPPSQVEQGLARDTQYNAQGCPYQWFRCQLRGRPRASRCRWSATRSTKRTTSVSRSSTALSPRSRTAIAVPAPRCWPQSPARSVSLMAPFVTQYEPRQCREEVPAATPRRTRLASARRRLTFRAAVPSARFVDRGDTGR